LAHWYKFVEGDSVLVLLPTLIALLAAAAGFVLAIRARKSAASLLRATTVPRSAEGSTREIVLGVRLRMLAALIVAVIVAFVVSQLFLGEVAAGLALAPGLGAAAGIVALGISPFPRLAPEDGLRQAELTPRTLGTFGPRWGFVLPILGTAVLIGLLIVTGASGSTIDGPFSHQFMVMVPPGGSSSAGPYPDWSYGIFILSGAIALIASVLFALHRITTAPRIGQRDAITLDAALRATLTRFVMLGGTAVIVLYLGVVSLSAGAAARTASQWSYLKPGIEEQLCGQKTNCSFTAPASDSVFGVVQPSYTLGAVGSVLGIILIGVAIALALLALTNFAIRWSATVPVEPQRVDA
jgi:hypothetical protein